MKALPTIRPGALGLALLMTACSPSASAPQADEARGVAGRGVEPWRPEIWEKTDFDPEQSLGLFVGVRTFTKDETIVEVPFAVDDAIDLAHLFSIELGLITPRRVWLFLSGEPQKPAARTRRGRLKERGAHFLPATRSDIFNVIFLENEIYRENRPALSGGLVVVSFATHGYTLKGTHYLMAEDSLSWRIEDTGFPSNYLSEAMALLKEAPRKILFLDACREVIEERGRGGEPDPHTQISDAFREAITRVEGQLILSAAPLGGYAYDDDESRNGVFSRAIIDGLLCEATTDKRGFVTVEKLHEYVESRVIHWLKANRKNSSGGWPSKSQEGPVGNLPLAICPLTKAKICQGNGLRLLSCGKGVIEVGIEDFWKEGGEVEMVSLVFKEAGEKSDKNSPSQARQEGGTHDLKLAHGSCTIHFTEVSRPCVEISTQTEEE